jgi:hypothetical protein
VCIVNLMMPLGTRKGAGGIWRCDGDAEANAHGGRAARCGARPEAEGPPADRTQVRPLVPEGPLMPARLSGDTEAFARTDGFGSFLIAPDDAEWTNDADVDQPAHRR